MPAYARREIVPSDEVGVYHCGRKSGTGPLPVKWITSQNLYLANNGPVPFSRRWPVFSAQRPVVLLVGSADKPSRPSAVEH